MSNRVILMIVANALLVAPCTAQQALTLVEVEDFGNFHTAGVVIEISGDDDWDGSAGLELQLPGSPTFLPAHTAVRIDGTHFVGSLFELDPDTEYAVRLTLTDPDGVTGVSQVEFLVNTRSDDFPEPSLRTLYVSPAGNNSNPGTDTAIQELLLNQPTPNSKGQRYGNFVQIRDVINEELEAVWADEKTVHEALDSAVERGNELLRQFEATNQ